MRIGIDIDSTLHHYWDVFQAVVRDMYGMDLDYHGQHDWLIPGLTPEQLRAAVARTHHEEHVIGCEPYPGAVEAVSRWHEAGHFIHITSHRAEDTHEVTSRWLDRIGLPYDELYVSYDKITKAKEIGIGLLVDDSPVNIVRALEQGITPATLRHPWNEDVCEHHGVISAADWPELERLLEPVLAS